MYIKTSKNALVSFKNEHTNGERVEFSENGVANVKEEIGEALVAEYDCFSEHTSGDNE